MIPTDRELGSGTADGRSFAEQMSGGQGNPTGERPTVFLVPVPRAPRTDPRQSCFADTESPIIGPHHHTDLAAGQPVNFPVSTDGKPIPVHRGDDPSCGTTNRPSLRAAKPAPASRRLPIPRPSSGIDRLKLWRDAGRSRM